MCPYYNMFKNIRNTLVSNSPKLETIQMSINKLMNKQFVTRSYDGRLLDS